MRCPNDSLAHALVAIVSKCFQPPEGCAARLERFASLEEALAVAPDLVALDIEGLASLPQGWSSRAGLVLLIDPVDSTLVATCSGVGAVAVIDRTASSAFCALAVDAAVERLLDLRERERTERQLELLRGDSPVGFWELDLATGGFWCSPECGALLEVDDRHLPSDLAGCIELLPESERARASEWFAACAREAHFPSLEHATRAGKRVRHVAHAFRAPDGTTQRVSGMIEAVQASTPRLGGTQSLPRPDEHQPESFTAQLERAIRIAARTAQHVAVLHVDVQRVSALTAHALSPDAADALLDGIAQRIREATREGDTVGRAAAQREACVVARAGEHFNVLLPDLARIHDAAKVATRIVEALARPFSVAGHELCVPAAVGIAGYPTDHTAADELVRRLSARRLARRVAGGAT